MKQDLEKFEQILSESQHMVRAYIAGLGVSSDEVDDIAQEVYVAFYKGMHKMPEDTIPIRWLKGIARNLCMNHFRKTKRKQARRYEAIAELLSEAETSGEPSLFAGAFESLKVCLQKLSESSRKLISLKYEKNLNAQEISRVVDMKAGAVRMAMLRIRESLRECIQDNMSRGMIHE
ncbi:MAG: sigma-70 family RNA polymerase sigma factor [Verrucomicrobiota bacterium]